MSVSLQESIQTAVNLIDSGAHQEAISHLISVKADYPAEPTIQFLLASVYASEEQVEKAKSSFESALAFAPEFYIARFQYGFYLVNLGELESALVHFFILENQKVDLPAYLALFSEAFIKLLSEKEPDNAIDLIKSGIEVNSENLALNKDMEKVITLFLSEKPESNVEQKPSTTGLSPSALLNIYN